MLFVVCCVTLAVCGNFDGNVGFMFGYVEFILWPHCLKVDIRSCGGLF